MRFERRDAAVRRFVIRPLTADRVEQAFPVVQSALRALPLARWRAYARRLAKSRSAGVLAAFDEQGYIAGLFSFEVDRDLRHGRVLRVRHLVAVDLIDPGPVLGALLQAIEETAVQRRCDRILIAQAPRTHDRSLDRLLAGHGYGMETVVFGKPVGGNQAPALAASERRDVDATYHDLH